MSDIGVEDCRCGSSSSARRKLGPGVTAVAPSGVCVLVGGSSTSPSVALLSKVETPVLKPSLSSSPPDKKYDGYASSSSSSSSSAERASVGVVSPVVGKFGSCTMMIGL